MSFQTTTHSSSWDENEATAALNSFLPAHFGPSNTTQTIVKAAEYIGSFMVTGRGHHDRAEIVRQKLEAARSYTHSKPIVLLISLNGIKVCRDTDKHVYMAHALRRISYATCDPENVQFAFLAREPKAEPNVQYCHAFVTRTPEQAEELNNIVGEAFRIAYAQQQLALLTQQFRQAAPTSVEASAQRLPAETHPIQSTVSQSSSVSAMSNVANGPGSIASIAGFTSHSSPIRSGTAIQTPHSAVHPAFLNKPLPPVPGTPINSMTADSRVDSNPSLTDPPLPPPPPADIVDIHRGNRPHKHHKHHKHRHRHRTRDVVAKTSDQLQDQYSVDSGLHTSTGESSVSVQLECTPRLPTAVQKPSGVIHRSQPPPPPPRGLSSLTPFRNVSGMDAGRILSSGDTHSYSPCIEQEHQDDHSAMSRADGDTQSRLQSRSLSDTVSPTDLQARFLAKSVNISLQSISGELSDGNIARPSSQASRPSSQHFYDMADHRSCGALPADSECNPRSDVVVTEPSSTITCSTTTSVVTTASSSTTGCSTTTSGSIHSGSGSAGSLSRSRLVGARTFETGTDPRPSCSTGDRNGLDSPRHSGDTRDQQGSAHSTGSSRHSRVPESGVRYTLDDAAELAHASWYQPHVPREVALEILSKQPPGSFVVRDSGSHANCYALSVRFGEGAAACSLSGTPSGGSSRELPGLSVYPHPASGISHFLIQRTPRGGVRLKGLDKEWPSLSCLVLHLTVMPEMLPCALTMPKASANPAFSPNDHGSGSTPCPRPHFEQAPGVSCAHFRPIHCAENSSLLDVPFGDEDEDYQRLSDFSSIMADLRLRPRVPIRSGELRKAR
ncbi:Tensin-4 [Clonorchis sinensis]|uniref:Tensin-4 n=2 Tax=Clonorchis sinensis TaxID=79923 RepID=A0A8T1MRK6_CLOSI|nr:Tensin-4 [Clonorchis sinensis]